MNRLTDLQIESLACHCCGQRAFHRVAISHSYEISHDGRPPVTITIPDLEVVQCGNPNCPGHQTDEAVIFDGATTHRITVETYRQLGLLTPDEIRAGREKLGLTQAELQSLLGLGGNSLSRWEKGRIYQARSMDTLLKLAFRVQSVIPFLRREAEKTLANEATPVILKYRFVQYGSQVGGHTGAPTSLKAG